MKKAVNGYGLRSMFIIGANRLENEKNNIDKLNVFPVPDGDTGTNMALTLNSAIKSLHNLSKDVSLEKVAKDMAHGALMGARGNSGVILSQLLSGFAKALENVEELNPFFLAKAFQKGVEAAYNAVVKPIEGTILTVAREASEKLNSSLSEDLTLEEGLNIFLTAGYNSLAKTPEILPVLKQAGVVDAGGKGFLIFVEGMLESLDDNAKIVNLSDFSLDKNKNLALQEGNSYKQDINFRYCTELIIKNFSKDTNINNLRKKLQKIGDSIVVVGSEELIKIHIHSNNPGIVLEQALALGTLHNIKIDNMEEQSQEVQLFTNKKIGVIAVSAGDGLTEIFKSLGVDYIITGGQTMNPSTEDIVNAIEQINAEKVIILPNNKNIILSAEQAVKLVSKPSSIVKTKTIPQGIGALMAFNGELDLVTNVKRMNEAISFIKTGEVTYAIRDAYHGQTEIKAGNVLGILEGDIVELGEELESVALNLIEKIIEDEELVTIYYGQDVKEDEAESLLNKLSDLYTDIDFELHYGGQPLYYYFISAE